MTANDLDGRIAATWNRFRELAERAEAEQKKHGAPLGETSWAMDGISRMLDKIEGDWLRQQRAGELEREHEQEGRLILNGQAFTYAKNTPEMWRFMSVLRSGMPKSETAQERVKLADVTDQMKSMARLDDTAGGFLAPPEFSNDLLRALVSVSPVRSVVTVLPIGGSASLVPVRTGVATAKRISETGSRVTTNGDPTFGVEQIGVHEAYAESLVSRALLSDSAYPLDAELTDSAARSFALLEGKEFVAGSGVGEMLGLDNATLPAGQIITCADSSGHLIGAADIQKLIYESVGSAYLPGARLLLNPRTLGAIRRLVATSGAIPMFPVEDAPGTLAGFPYALLPDLADNATPAAGRNLIYLIHPQVYRLVVRDDITVIRLVEKYADTGQIGYLIFSRTGGGPVDTRGIARLVTG